MFLQLVELESQKDIEAALLNCLDTAGFSEELLQNNPQVSFVSDGASVMLDKNSGVATRSIISTVSPIKIHWSF